MTATKEKNADLVTLDQLTYREVFIYGIRIYIFLGSIGDQAIVEAIAQADRGYWVGLPKHINARLPVDTKIRRFVPIEPIT